MAEFYRDEHPKEPGVGGPGNPGGSGGGGWWWGSTGGGTGGWGWNWNWGGGSGTPGGSDWDYGWGGQKTSIPFLKTSTRGFLIIDSSRRLLTSDLVCRIEPPVLVYLSGEDYRKHLDCALLQLSDPQRSFTVEIQPEGDISLLGYFSWATPGSFDLLAKWQAGHYDHAKIGTARFVVYGIDLGVLTMPLKHWMEIARITITPDHRVFVNGLRGDINGNQAFVEKQ